jgi:hypothetical protein
MSGELLCERCGQNHPIWYTDNETWNAVIRDEPSNYVFHFLCPSCFCFLAFIHFGGATFKVTLEAPQNTEEKTGTSPNNRSQQSGGEVTWVDVT